ncbi:MAG: cobalamin-binding protein [Dehalococcoidia bacterium]|nr:MAG: cobalamin-binding protein [Dehalococcoidia bacterium]
MKITWRRMVMLSIVLVVILGLLVTCTPPAAEEPTAPHVEGAAFPLEIIDQAGRTVRVDKLPEKIISLAPSNTEILYALGLEDRVVGVTEYCDYPEAARQKPQIGGYSTVDVEKVVAIQPDLILAASLHQDEVVPRLEGLNLTVLVLAPRTIGEVLDAISLVGAVAGKAEEATNLTAEMEGRIKAVTDKTALPEEQRPRVLYVLWHNPLMTVGSETRIHELIERAGGINIAQDLTEEYPKISLEAVIMANPQVIIAGSGHGSGQDIPVQFALAEPRLAGVEARLNNRVYEIDSNLTSRPGPRIVDGLEKLAEFIHPELFKESL